MTSALGRKLAAGDAPAVVAAVGPEVWLRNETLREIAAAVLGSADSPDLVTLQAEGGSAAEAERATSERFFGEARTPSMFGARKVVVLRGAEGPVSKDKAAFLAWLGSPAPTVTCVLLADSLPADVERAIESAGVLVRCGSAPGRPGVRGESPERFVARRAAERGKRIGSAEAGLLVELVGAELSALDGAVEILALHAGDEPAIGRAHVEALFQSAREGSVWTFGDALAEGDVPAALREASRCFAEGVPEDAAKRRVTRDESRVALRLLSAFVASVTRALALRRQLDAGVPRGAVDFGRPLPWSAREAALNTASRRRAEALETLLLRAEETERAMKSGGATGRVALVRLVTAVGTVR